MLLFLKASSSLPFSLQFSLVRSEPRVGDFLGGAGKASPPADALPAGEAAPADRLAPLGHPLGAGAFPRHAAGELLQGSAQRHEGIHFQLLSRVGVGQLIRWSLPSCRDVSLFSL